MRQKDRKGYGKVGWLMVLVWILISGGSMQAKAESPSYAADFWKEEKPVATEEFWRRGEVDQEIAIDAEGEFSIAEEAAVTEEEDGLEDELLQMEKERRKVKETPKKVKIQASPEGGHKKRQEKKEEPLQVKRKEAVAKAEEIGDGKYHIIIEGNYDGKILSCRLGGREVIAREEGQEVFLENIKADQEGQVCLILYENLEGEIGLLEAGLPCGKRREGKSGQEKEAGSGGKKGEKRHSLLGALLRCLLQ